MKRGLTAIALEPTPARPGPGAMPDELLRVLEMTIGRRVDGLLSGDHRSTLLGRGTELAQVRPYIAGDDPRRLDWNVTARTGTPHVRVELAERVLVTWLLADLSPSMAFGTAERRKADVAAGALLALGHAASVRGNRVGVLTFGRADERMLPPRQGRAGLLGVMLTLRESDVEASPGGHSLASALRRLAAIAKQRALVCVISDFRGQIDWRPALVEIAGRHDVLAVEIRDPREQVLPNVGELTLIDSETGQRLRVDTRSKALRERFTAAARAERAAVARTLAQTGAHHVVLSTDGEWLQPLAASLRARRRRR